MQVRIVLDTNILISACWKPGGLEARTLAMALTGPAMPCITTAVWAEYEEVLKRKKFASRKGSIEAIMLSLRARAMRVEAGEKLNLAADDDDNRFLECAVAASAQYLITGNLRHYPDAVENTRIVNSREFLNAVLGDSFQEF